MRPETRLCRRMWSSSLTMMESRSPGATKSPRGREDSDSSWLTRCRSTSSVRSISPRSCKGRKVPPRNEFERVAARSTLPRTLLSSSSRARCVNGAERRLRASRMRVESTISGCDPVPSSQGLGREIMFSKLGVRGIIAPSRSSSWFSGRDSMPAGLALARGFRAGARDRGFEHADLVAKLGRSLEIFAVDGALELVLKALHLSRPCHGLSLLGRVLARMARAAVDTAQERPQLGLERDVAFGATETAGFLESRVVEATAGALDRADLLLFPGRHAVDHAGQELGDGELLGPHLRGQALLLGAGLADVQLRAPVVLDLGEVQRRRVLVADLTDHYAPVSSGVAVRTRPPSKTSTRDARLAS